MNERLELLSVDPAIKERLQYFWGLAQLMKGWSMDNECIMEVPEVLEAISAISDEDRKKLSDIVRFKGFTAFHFHLFSMFLDSRLQSLATLRHSVSNDTTNSKMSVAQC